MIRLIDADKLLNRIAELFRNDDLYLVGKFIGLIEQQPTAFNVEKVVEQLEKESYYIDIETDREVVNLNEAIEIVRKGGV